MKYWPVPDSYLKILPKDGSPGSFWENRGDRFHCGVDIYAPYNSNVISIDKGMVIKTGIFTSPKKVEYWNETKYVIIKNQDGFYCKYAELRDLFVKKKESVDAGQLIAIVGTVLNIRKIKNTSPTYVQKLKDRGNNSMLHFELYSSQPFDSTKYLGGNWFGNNKLKNLLNPEIELKNLL